MAEVLVAGQKAGRRATTEALCDPISSQHAGMQVVWLVLPAMTVTVEDYSRVGLLMYGRLRLSMKVYYTVLHPSGRFLRPLQHHSHLHRQ